PEGLEGRQRVRIDRLGDEDSAGLECAARELEKAFELLERKVLYDVDRGHGAEAARLEALEARDRVGLLNRESLGTAALDHSRVWIDPARLDSRVAEQLQQLAAAAADVEDLGMAAEDRDVGRQQ